MKLAQIASGRFTVYAFVDESDSCYVMEKLVSVKKRYPQLTTDALVLLREVCPRHGELLEELPSEVDGTRIHRSQEFASLPGMYYFKIHSPLDRDEPALRIPWFYADGSKRKLLCTHAFLKANGTPQREVRKAAAIRKRCLETTKPIPIEVA